LCPSSNIQKNKIILAIGDVEGISKVEDRLTVALSAINWYWRLTVLKNFLPVTGLQL